MRDLEEERGKIPRCLREPINHSARIKGSKDEKRRRTVGRTAGRHAAEGTDRKETRSFLFLPREEQLPSLRERSAQDHFLFLSFSKFVGRLTHCQGEPAETFERQAPSRGPPGTGRTGPDSLTDNAILPARLRFLTISVRGIALEEWSSNATRRARKSAPSSKSARANDRRRYLFFLFIYICMYIDRRSI